MKSLWTTFRYTFFHLRWQVIGWGLGLALYGLMIVPMYETLGCTQDDSPANDCQLSSQSFWLSLEQMSTVQSRQQDSSECMLFRCLPVIIGIFAVIAGSGLDCQRRRTWTLGSDHCAIRLGVPRFSGVESWSFWLHLHNRSYWPGWDSALCPR